MKRTWICIILSLTLSTFLLSGCGTPGSSGGQLKEDQSTDTDQTSDTSPNGTETDGTETDGTEAGNDSQTTANDGIDSVQLELSQLSHMEKALDSLMLCCFENDRTYDSQDPSFFWTALSYGIVNHAKEIPLAEHTEDGIRVPRMAVQEFATGLFADYGDLPALSPEIIGISYDADWDAYLFSPSDRGETYTRLLNAFQNEDGSVTAAAVLYDGETNSPISCYLFTLVSNLYADGIENPLFLYSVSSMTRSSAVNSGDGLPSLIGSYQGFSDSHTVEFIIDGNLMAFQVYDREIVSLLSLLEENAEVTFAVEIDELTESRTITSIIGK